jgi:hypothetical protein
VGSFQVPGSGARCRGGVRNASSPHRGRDRPRRALGKTDSGGRWLRVHLERPGVLLLRRLGPRRAEGSGGRHVRTHWFGHAHLPNSGRYMPVWLCADMHIVNGCSDRQFGLVARIGARRTPITCWRELRRQRLLRHADDPIMCACRLPGGRSSHKTDGPVVASRILAIQIAEEGGPQAPNSDGLRAAEAPGVEARAAVNTPRVSGP